MRTDTCWLTLTGSLFTVHEDGARYAGSGPLSLRIVPRIVAFDGVRYSGAIRSPPSNRITEPFMKMFSAM